MSHELKMKAQLVQLLGLSAEADEAQIVKAVADLVTTTAREKEIQALMRTTGMQRHDAENLIDQRAREDSARKATSSRARREIGKDFMTRQLSPSGL